MNIATVGISFKTSTNEILAAVALNAEDRAKALIKLHESVESAVVLSTCNRTELYALPGDARTSDVLRQFLIDRGIENGLSASDVSSAIYTHRGESALRHLFRVASGLDSMVPGDSEIAGQLRKAFAEAVEFTAVPATLSKPIQSALRAAKRVRSEAGITAFAPSVASTALELLHSSLAGAKDAKVAIIGTGKFARILSGKAICAGIADLTIVSRDYQRAKETARPIGAAAASTADLERLVFDLDVVISCTLVKEPIIKSSTLAQRDPDHNITLLDLSVPSSIDQDVRNLDGVTLLNMDDIQNHAEKVDAVHANSLERAESVLQEELKAMRSDSPQQRANSAIQKLAQTAESHRVYEVERAKRNLESGSATIDGVLEAMSKAIVKRMLADPITIMKQSDNPESLLSLFGLRHSDPSRNLKDGRQIRKSKDNSGHLDA